MENSNGIRTDTTDNFADDFTDDFEFGNEGDFASRTSGGVYQSSAGNQSNESVLADDFDDDFNDSFLAADVANAVSSLASGSTGNESTSEIAVSGSDTVDASAEGDGVETIMSLSPEDLSIEMDEDIAEDVEAFEQEKAALESLGYKIDSDAGFEVIDALKEREALVHNADEALSRMVIKFYDSVRALEEKASGSRATLTKTDVTDNSVYLRNNSSFTGIQNAVACKIIEENVHEAAITGRSVSVPEIMQQLRMIPGYAPLPDGSHERMIKRYVEEALPIIKSQHQSKLHHTQTLANHRQKISEYLFRDALLEIKNLASASKNKGLFFIRKVINKNGKFFIECPECKELLPVDHSPVTLIRFDTEKKELDSVAINVMPKSYKCNHGHHLLFTDPEYEKMWKLTIKSSNGMRAAISYASEFCHGSSCLYLEPSFSSVIDAISYIVTNEAEDNSKDFTDADDSSAELDEIPRLGDLEFIRAIEDFYSKLSFISPMAFNMKRPFSDNISGDENTGDNGDIEESGKFDIISSCQADVDRGYGYRDRIKELSVNLNKIAYFVCKTTSKDYQEVKNMAIFSVVMWLSSNPILSKYLDAYNAQELLGTIKFVDSIKEDQIKLLSSDRKSVLVNLAVVLNAQRGNNNFYKELNEDEMIQWLVKNKSLLQKEYDDFQARADECMGMLEYYTDSVGFLPITKVSSMRLSDLICYTTSERFMKWLDVVTSLMIVTNYSEELTQRLPGVLYFTKSDVISMLQSNATTIKLKKKLINVFKAFESPAFYDIGQICNPSVDEYAALKKVSKSLAEQNYYKFCAAVTSIDSLLVPSSDDVTSYSLTMAINALTSEATKVTNKSEIEWAVGDQMTKEEIEGYYHQLDTISFSNYVPVREHGEPAKDFVARLKAYSKGATTSGLIKSNANDIYDNYKEKVLVSIAALRGSNEYNSYCVSMYMATVLKNLCTRYDSLRSFIGISTCLDNAMQNDLVYASKLFSVDCKGMLDVASLFTSIFVGYTATVVDSICRSLSDRVITVDDVLSDVVSRDLAEQIVSECGDGLRSIESSGDDVVIDVEQSLDEIRSQLSLESLRQLTEGI